jgi:hypothetical protein
MRDDQVRRYARHILLPDVGGLGQTALMVATARVSIDGEPSAALIAATYLAAGGVGGLVVIGATESQLASIGARGPDTTLHAPDHEAKVLDIPSTPAWWPPGAGDATALAYWRGGIAATRWMADVANR